MKVSDFTEDQMYIILYALAECVGFKVLSVQHDKLNVSVNTPAGAKTFHWNPITENSDAMKLMCTAGLKVDVDMKNNVTVASSTAIVDHGTDVESATRLAIVLAALEQMSK
jgi:hypothetical protein